MTTYLVTGGAGFIGSALVRQLIAETAVRVANLDCLTYAGNLDSLGAALDDSRHVFYQVDVCDAASLGEILERESPDGVIHLAAESHVDRSIDGPAAFVRTNLVGTFTLLEQTLQYYRELTPERRGAFRFLHVSTDEVFGSLGAEGSFNETTPYNPRSPYSASKAGADHLVRSFHHTYGLPAIVTNCSNNYGPCQFPEKLIPLTIHKALAGEPIPVYGRGENVRDWLYVDDHARALRAAIQKGRPGETYAIGGGEERRNLEVVHEICDALDDLRPLTSGRYKELIAFVPDRPGHDFRYAIDSSRARTELDWAPLERFPSGIRRTVRWYLDNRDWTERVMTGAYRGERLGQAQ